MRSVLLAVLALGGACSSSPYRDGPFTDDIFEDIPAPRAAVYRHANAESFSYTSGSLTFRCGRFEYTYKGSQPELVEFFTQTMTAPPYSWALEKEESLVEGSTLLVFTKSDDRCTVDVERRAIRHRSGSDDLVILVRVNFLR